MKEKLELKHLAPYLPYELETDKGLLHAICMDNLAKVKLGGEIVKGKIENLRPILRPISDLTKEIEHNGEKFFPLKKLKHLDSPIGGFHTDRFEIIIKNPLKFSIGETNFSIIERILEWHFDAFGLIEKDLAIDINTLEK